MKKIRRAIRNYFRRKVMVHSSKFHPAELVKVHMGWDGKKYVRIAFTNRQKIPGHHPVTDIEMKHVIGYRRIPSRFDKHLYRLVGKMPQGKMGKFK